MSQLSRRGAMGGATTLMAVPTGAWPAAGSQPDRELVAACARFCDAERAWQAAIAAVSRFPCGSPEEARHEAEADRICLLQRSHLATILALPCTTLAGLRAVAGALAEWDQELFNPRNDDASQLLAARLVRAVLAMGGAP